MFTHNRVPSRVQCRIGVGAHAPRLSTSSPPMPHDLTDRATAAPDVQCQHTYGIEVADPDVELLLRHRATFFGLTGLGLIVATMVPGHRSPAITVGVLSLGSYIALAEAIETPNTRLEHVKRIDIALVMALVAAALLTTRVEES